MLAIKETENANDPVNGVETETKTEGTTEEKDDTPPTGVSTIYVTTATLLATVSAGAIVMINKIISKNNIV